MDFSLNCLLVGDDLDRIFTVKIPKTDNVSILKDLIHRKIRILNHVGPRYLDLWAVNLDPHGLTQETVNHHAIDKDRRLTALTKLSSISIFNNVPNEYFLHILAKAPGTS
jgi:Crinkler effector protein N-terminal domain